MPTICIYFITPSKDVLGKDMLVNYPTRLTRKTWSVDGCGTDDTDVVLGERSLPSNHGFKRFTTIVFSNFFFLYACITNTCNIKYKCLHAKWLHLINKRMVLTYLGRVHIGHVKRFSVPHRKMCPHGH
jgi:hypothetical protein